MLLAEAVGSAATIYSENGSLAGSNALGGGLIILTAGWSSTASYLNIAIEATVGQFNGPITISAYLTRQIGPGNDNGGADCYVTFSPSSNAEIATLFSGVTLFPWLLLSNAECAVRRKLAFGVYRYCPEL
jgi:hypothetical protein